MKNVVQIDVYTVRTRSEAKNGGTDAPAVHYNPFLSLWWMITRNTLTAGPLGPDQKITPQETIRLYTIGSAYFPFEEKAKGSLEPGKPADLVILDKDILSCSEDEIKNIRPATTMLRRRWVYEAKRERMPIRFISHRSLQLRSEFLLRTNLF